MINEAATKYIIPIIYNYFSVHSELQVISISYNYKIYGMYVICRLHSTTMSACRCNLCTSNKTIFIIIIKKLYQSLYQLHHS